MVMLGRKFHSPKNTNTVQWKKVQALAERGFYFQSVYRANPEGGKQVVPYPRTVKEVPAFAAEFKDQALTVQPTTWSSQRTGLLGLLK